MYYNDDPGAFDSDSESGTYETSECDIDGLFAILNGITLPAGTYYVVVDGFDAETGNYGLFLEESESTEYSVSCHAYACNYCTMVWFLSVNHVSSLSLSWDRDTKLIQIF